MLIVHASDLHLGRPLRAIRPHSGLDRSRFQRVGELALAKLVNLCLIRRASLLLLAGDLIDHWQRDYSLGLRLIRELSRLEQVGTQVYCVRGNHDAENRVIRNLLLPDHVKELGLSGVQTVLLEHLGLRLVGASYAKRITTDNLFAAFPPPISSLTNVGVLHTSAEGMSTRDSYAPCRKSELVARGYDYLALGHVHEPQLLSKRPVIAYSGCLQGRSFTESGPHGCKLLTIEPNRELAVVDQALDVVRFGKVTISVSECRNLDQVQVAIAQGCQRLLSRLPNHGLVVRFCVKGERGIEALMKCGTKPRAHLLREAAESQSERLSVDGFWSGAANEEAPTFRLDEE